MSLRRCLAFLFALLPLSAYAADQERILDAIELPPGFEIQVFGEVPNARSLAQAPDGTVFIGNRSGDKVWALRDNDDDGVADQRLVLAEGLDTPNGVAFHNGDLYIAEISRILRLDDILARLDNPPKPVVVNDDYPTDDHHGWKFIAFGPDGKLYVPIGAPCNICNEEGYALISRINPDGTGYEVFARGIRNTVGFDWHPETGELWFTDNGRDWLGDNRPEDELNHAPQAGLHFGYPYCHQGNIPDPEFGEGHDCDDYVAPEALLGPHVAGLGVRFYTGESFPAKYHGGMFIAEHGSWNRSEKIGYRVKFAREVDGGIEQEVFARGWLQADGSVLGRPVDVLVREDGSLLVSDDATGLVYRIHYTGEPSGS